MSHALDSVRFQEEHGRREIVPVGVSVKDAETWHSVTPWVGPSAI